MFDSITVPNYYSKLFDAFNCARINIICGSAKKVCLRFCCGIEKKSFTKPKSLEDMPDSDSSSVDDDVSNAQLSLNSGSILYLQTPKTLVVLFGILSVFNIPVYLLYKASADLSFTMDGFSDTFALFSFG